MTQAAIKIDLIKMGPIIHNLNQVCKESSLVDIRYSTDRGSGELSQYRDAFPYAVLIGCGGIGAWVGFMMASADITEHMILFDSDRVEGHNHSRFLYPNELTGEYKSIALASLIKQSRPDTLISTFERDFDPIVDIKSILESQTTQQFARLGNQGTSLGEFCFRRIQEGREEGPIQFSREISIRDRCNAFFTGDYSPRFIPIIDSTDNPSFQQALSEEVNKITDSKLNQWIQFFDSSRPTDTITRRMLIPIYIRVSYNGGNHVTITTKGSSWGIENATGRYDIIPSFALPAIIGAAYGVYGLLQHVQAVHLDTYRRALKKMFPQNPLVALERQLAATATTGAAHLTWMAFSNIPPFEWNMYRNHMKLESYQWRLLDENLSDAETQELLSRNIPSLYPSIAFGSAENIIMLDKKE